jgi:cytoplasmic iron level regulating protein YaaA (DUF328/UPF0246 family)
VRVLLPPSEAKTPGGRGRSLAARPPHPTLGAARERTLSALAELLDGPAADAAAALLLPPGTIDEALTANARVRTARTTPALERYAGVVYDGLASAGLDAAELRVAARTLLVFSGLFGVVRGDEPVPPYRVPAKAVLPGIGVAGTFWRPVLDDAMPTLLFRGGLVVDLRSSDYAAMWRPTGVLARRVVTVRVLSPLPSGRLGVVSYPSKFAKGQLAAALVRRLTAGEPVETVADVAAAWLAGGGAHAEAEGANHLVLYTA